MLAVILGIFLIQIGYAQPKPPPPPVPPIPPIKIEIGGEGGGFMNAIRIMLLLTILTLAPSILIMITSFTRIVIVFFFLRQALALQQTPPNQVLVGLSLFLTIYIMGPTLQDVYKNAYKPYSEAKLNEEGFIGEAIKPFRKFMFAQVREKELALFVKLSKSPRPKNKDDVSVFTLIPAFMVSEIKTAFEIGFVLYMPFLVIDVVIASVLMSMGMLMVPPIMISLPFKLVVFVAADGWTLLINSLVRSFRV